MSDFKPFSVAVHARFVELSKQELFITAPGQDVWDLYLKSYPEGSNPIFKTRTTHDCSCCKQFIRGIGNVVAIVDGKLKSIWSVKGLQSPYAEVAAALAEFVEAQPITDLFRPSEPSYGAEQTKQLLEGGEVIRWNHFHGTIAAAHRSATPDKARGDFRTSVQVFHRALTELSADALTTVVDLIDSNGLYRGTEHRKAVAGFREVQTKYAKLGGDGDRNLFLWANAGSPVAHFRNTVIGTLVTDLSSGVELEHAVRSFESKVAPTNYKRPTALITPAMIKQAMATVAELGLETALERRFATISDVSVNNVLWVDNEVKPLMKGGLEGLLMTASASHQLAFSKVPEPISIDDFMAKVLPSATSIDLLVKGVYLNNLMSLTAPIHAGSGKLFKWGNNFGWSYNGNIADSIKEKVKSAGGNVTSAKMRVSLAWSNFDDLDIHVYEPNNNHIYFGNKSNKLDVDMNAGEGRSREPVENVSWTTVHDGVYRVAVNQYFQRETSDVGCVVEIENAGEIIQLSYAKALKGMVDFAEITVAAGKIVKVKPAAGIAGGGISREQWGIKTETYAKVQTLMFSPNYWDDQAVGNKHWFFMLEGCKNPEPARGIYNEFLSSELDKHRKVFEVLGDKTKCAATDNQLSGMGFSSTRSDVVTVNVRSAKFQKSFNITF